MNRKEALDWCSIYLKYWPELNYRNEIMVKPEYPSGWCFVVDCDSVPKTVILYSNEGLYPLREKDWLDAKADKEKDMNAIDLENAPEGATHCYIVRSGSEVINTSYFRHEDSKWHYYKELTEKWTPYRDQDIIHYTLGRCELIEINKYEVVDLKCADRPTEQPYMPQVGQECECDFHKSGQAVISVKCYIVGLSKDKRNFIYHIYHDDSLNFTSVVSGSIFFRPIKTEREKNIEGMKSIIDAWHRNGNNGTLLLASLLNEAGYKSNAPTT